RQSRYVDNVLTSGRHLLQLINDILDLSKVEAGRMELDFSQFDVVEALRSVESIVKTLATKKKINFTIEAEDALPKLTADQSKFKQVMYNLVSNAIKYTPDGGSVSIHAERSNGRLRVTVTDSGIGIKSEDL